MPAYRYLPGLQPHPSRDPAFHQFREFRSVHTPQTGGPGDRRFLRALDLFDHRYYWESHEVLEEVWLELDRADPFAQLCQGLIQCAAATLASHAGRHAAADRLLGRAARRFGKARSALGRRPGRVDTSAVLARVRAFLRGGPYPSIR